MSENEEKKTNEQTDENKKETVNEHTEKIEKPQETKQTETASSNNTESAQKEKTAPEKAAAQPKQKEKGNSESGWKTVAIILASLIVGFCGGLLSGHMTAKNEIAEFKEEESQNQQNNFPNFFRGFGSPEFGGNGSSSSGQQQENTNKAALGIMVQDTENGPEIVDFTAGNKASSAGLQKGDIITKVDDTKVSSVAEVRAAIADKEAGDTVSITVTRNGKEQDPVKVTLIDNTANSEHSDFPDGSNIQG